MNAVIYARYSSDSRREESIEGQLRPKSRHIIKDSAKELFEIVLVWKPDRLSCDRYDSVHYKHILKKNSVKVVSAKEHISECPEGIIPKAMPSYQRKSIRAFLMRRLPKCPVRRGLLLARNAAGTNVFTDAKRVSVMSIRR